MSEFDKYLVNGELTINGQSFGDDKQYFLIRGMLNHCPCGEPADHLKWILAGMEIIDSRFKDSWATHNKKISKHFVSYPGYRFFLQTIDKLGFANSCDGWLEDEGKELLYMLREWESEIS